MAIAQDESYRISGHTIRFFAGDLAALPERVDAIISSDDNYLSHGEGVSRALWKVAGSELADFVRSSRPQLRLGDVFTSPAFGLNARLIVHAISIDLDQNRTITEADLPGLYLRIFEVVAAENCQRVGLPLIGAGAAGVSARASATAFIDALASGFPVPAGVVQFTLAIPQASDSKAIDVVREAQERERDIEEALGQVISRMPGESGEMLRDAWRQYASGDPEVRGASLALLWGHVSDLLERSPSSVDRAVVQHLSRAANLARNRIAHGRTVKAQDWGTLLSAVRQALAETLNHLESVDPTAISASASRVQDREWNFLTADAEVAERDVRPSKRGSQPPLDLRFAAETAVAAARLSAPATPSPSRMDREAPTARGPAPVRELRDFLTAHLPADSLSELYRRLEAEGNRGAPEIQLLELLIHEDDLVELVAGEFGTAKLRTAVLAFRGEEPPAELRTATKLASWFLRTLGFPQPVRPAGLRAVRQAVQSANAQLLLNDDVALRGAVGDVAQRLEYLCRVMLRFICQAAYRKAPELLFREWGKLDEGKTLSTAGLGALVILVECLNSHLSRDDSPEVQLFMRDVAKGPLFPENAGDLPGLRNAFSHYRQEESGASLKLQAKKFLDAATKFLQYLDRAEGRIFPRIVLIEKIHFDRWGRKVIEGIDDEGNREVIFTDDSVSPGETYFMHPLTNPLRVDPILVPAGDLLWVDR